MTATTSPEDWIGDAADGAEVGVEAGTSVMASAVVDVGEMVGRGPVTLQKSAVKGLVQLSKTPLSGTLLSEKP